MIFRAVLLATLPIVSALADFTLESGKNTIFENVYADQFETLLHLEISNPKVLILFSGTPGMGKSTVAKELEQRFSAVRISSDEGRNHLSNNGLSRGLSDEYMKWFLEKVVSQTPNQCFILDRSIDRHFSFYESFAKKHGFQIFVIRMDVSKEILTKRIIDRKKSVEAYLSHLHKYMADYDAFNQTHEVDFVFNNDEEHTQNITRLASAISQKITKPSFQKRYPTSSQSYEEMRAKILACPQHEIEFPYENMHEILPGLYLGNQIAGLKVPLTIRYVVSCRSMPERPHAYHVIWKPIRIHDVPEANLSAYFADVFEFIDSAKGNILIHCMKGNSRSATLVIAYIMRKFDVPFKSAYNYVKSRRPTINPNSGFLLQLEEYEKTISTTTATHTFRDAPRNAVGK